MAGETTRNAAKHIKVAVWPEAYLQGWKGGRLTWKEPFNNFCQ